MPHRLEVTLKPELFDAEGETLRRKAWDYFGIHLDTVRTVSIITIDADLSPEQLNLLANIELNPYIPAWTGRETEVGEIKGSQGFSTPEEALFLIRGLNAYDIFPNWIALNNGTTHGIEASGYGIQVELTHAIREALAPYNVSSAQHGTSGNNSYRLREIAARTRTTKANVATALQMVSWGLDVNDYGNAILDADGNFKKLNLPFENQVLWQPTAVSESKNFSTPLCREKGKGHGSDDMVQNIC